METIFKIQNSRFKIQCRLVNDIYGLMRFIFKEIPYFFTMSLPVLVRFLSRFASSKWQVLPSKIDLSFRLKNMKRQRNVLREKSHGNWQFSDINE